MAQCNECQTTDEDLYYYWQGDIEEDYDLGNNDCFPVTIDFSYI